MLPCIVFVESVEVVDGEEDAQAVDEDPDHVEDIVSVGTLGHHSSIINKYVSLYW